MSTPAPPRKSLRASLWALRRPLAVAALLSAVANLMLLTPTLYLLQVYDRVLVSLNELTLAAISMICLFLLGVMATAEWTRTRLLVRTGLRLDEALSARLFDAGFHSRFAGDPAPAGRAFADLLQLRQFLTGTGVLAVFDAPWAPIYIAVIFLLHPVLGYVALAFVLAQAALAWFGQRRTVAPAQAAAQAATEASLFLKGKLRQAPVLEALGMREAVRQRWQQRNEQALQAASAQQAASDRAASASRFLRHLQQSLGLGAAALLVIDGQLSPGAMIAASVLMGRALAPLDQLVTHWRALTLARLAHGRLEELLRQYETDEPEPHDVVPRGEVTLRKLVATAPGRAEPILKGIELRVPAGIVVAVMGPSGSGKSTLARALLGIWPDTAGEALLDGEPVSRWNRAQLGPHVGYLPQDVQLFDGTIAENIARFGPVDSAKVIAAARLCGLHEMVLRFPQGYETPLGDGGRLLSGGQRQRIALARAVYGEPALVVLDEPNASLDDAGEVALAHAIRQLKARGRTVFLVTQRPGIIAEADWLLLLHDGRCVACGPREALLKALHVRQPAGAGGAGPASPRPA